MKLSDKNNRTICIKLSDYHLDQLRRRADQFCEGNVSAWIRCAGLAYTPILPPPTAKKKGKHYARRAV